MKKRSHLSDPIIRLAKRADEDFIQLARSLNMLHDLDKAEYKATLTRAGLGSRKAFYLREIDRLLRSLGVPDSRFIELGWTKTQIIAPHLTKGNAQRLIKLAEDHPAKQLQALMRGKVKRPKRRCVILYLGPSQYSAFEAAVLANGGKRHAKRGLAGKERAIMKVIRAGKLSRRGPGKATK